MSIYVDKIIKIREIGESIATIKFPLFYIVDSRRVDVSINPQTYFRFIHRFDWCEQYAWYMRANRIFSAHVLYTNETFLSFIS